MTLTANESKELLALARERNQVLAVGHLLMYHPALLKLRQLIREGELGDLLSIHCTRVNLGKVRNEENVWWSLAPHDISILSLLLEEPFELVSALPQIPLGRPEIEDTVYAQFRTLSGRSATINVSWLSPVKRHETVVIGSKKIAIFEDTKPLERKLCLMDYNLERSGDRIDAITKGEVQYIPLEMPDELLALEAKAFLEAVQSSRPLVNDGENGLQVVEILEAVQSQLNRYRHPAKSPVAV